MESKTEFENDRVRVLRVKHAARESHPQASKQDRLIIYLNEGHRGAVCCASLNPRRGQCPFATP
jgi:hypothetical protein